MGASLHSSKSLHATPGDMTNDQKRFKKSKEKVPPVKLENHLGCDVYIWSACDLDVRWRNRDKDREKTEVQPEAWQRQRQTQRQRQIQIQTQEIDIGKDTEIETYID